jgi:hypothetical protein
MLEAQPAPEGLFLMLHVKTRALVVTLAFLRMAAPAQAQESAKPTLTPADYIEIQQLVARYAHAIDTCSNNGYDYADLYVPDGQYSNSRSKTKWIGRERLAEAAGGGKNGCKKLQTENARSHTITNLVIDPAPEGATGKSYLVYPGVRGQHSDADHSGHVGGYQDVYVKTPAGWRFKSRIHVFPPDIPGSYKPAD